ncbi:hypothetical protein PSY17_23055, partial [Shigella flexneri]|nr:hypothetical protein [Shigella flexneri]
MPLACGFGAHVILFRSVSVSPAFLALSGIFSPPRASMFFCARLLGFLSSLPRLFFCGFSDFLRVVAPPAAAPASV